MRKKSFFLSEKTRKYRKCPALLSESRTDFCDSNMRPELEAIKFQLSSSMCRNDNMLILSLIVIMTRAGHLRYFYMFFNYKNDIFALFNKLIGLGVDFLNRNGAEIGYRVIVLSK